MTNRYLIEMTLECGHTISNKTTRQYYALAPWVCGKCHEPMMCQKVTITLLAKNIKEIKQLETLPNE